MKLSLLRRAAVAATTGLILVTFGACSSTKTVHSQNNVIGDGSLTIALSADPGSLDPQRSVNGPNLLMSVFGYDTPVTLLDNGKLATQVLTSWKAGDKSYVLTVRKGVTCADGSAMDAKTIAANINYIAKPTNQSPMAGIAVPSGATATADNAAGTVTVSMPSNSPFFIQNLAELPLVCAKGLANRKPLATTTDGSGPYILSSVAPGDHYDYVLRKGYTWGPNGARTDVKGLPPKITFRVITSTTTTANLLLNGQVNVAKLSGSDTTRLKAGGLFSAGSPLIGNELAFNESAGEAVADMAVRRALIADLNLPDLAKVDTGGLGQAADGLIANPKICGGNTMKRVTPSYDVTAAKAELTAAGWTVGSGGVRFKNGNKLSVSLVFANSEPTNSATAEYIADQWKQIGVDVTLNEQSFDQDSAVVFGKGGWGATLIGLGVSNPQALVGFFSGPAPTKGNNFGHFGNATYNELVAKAQAKDGISGCPDWNAAESALFKDADITPISTKPFLFWGKNAKFDVIAHILIPTSLRIIG